MKFGLTGSGSDSEAGPSAPSTPPPPPPPRTNNKRMMRPLPSSYKLSLSTKNKTPYTPPPLARTNKPLPTQPKLKAKRGRLLLPSSDSSDSDFASEDESESDGTDEEGSQDSEEEEWPVGPIGSVGIGGWRRRGSESRRRSKGKGKETAFDEETRIWTEGGEGTDVWELWDQKEKASSWATANKSFHLSLSRSLRNSSSTPMTDAAHSSDLNSIQTLLASLALAQTKSQSDLLASFESRNRALWSSIEDSILEAEKEAGEKQQLMEENRLKREENERKAKEMREGETKKLEEEKKKLEEGKAEEEKNKALEKKKKEDESSKVANELKELARLKTESGKVKEGSPQFEWERWTAKMLYIKQTVLPVVSQNPAYSKACYTKKRAITPKIGQLTSSASLTATIISQLDELLNSLRPPPGQESAIEPYIWLLNHLSKALVKQAEQEVTAKLGTAYPLGRVVVGLIGRGHVELGEVLMARLVKKCFWITGYWPRKRPGQTDEEHQKALGHAPPSQAESLTQYSTRMSGLVALYSAILQTSPLLAPQGPIPPTALVNIPSHFRPSAAWPFLTYLLSPSLAALEPTPLLLITFLEISSRNLAAIYGRQWQKFLECLIREGLREKKAGFSDKSRSSTVRLELWLEEWEKKGVMEAPDGWEVAS